MNFIDGQIAATRFHVQNICERLCYLTAHTSFGFGPSEQLCIDADSWKMNSNLCLAFSRRWRMMIALAAFIESGAGKCRIEWDQMPQIPADVIHSYSMFFCPEKWFFIVSERKRPSALFFVILYHSRFDRCDTDLRPDFVRNQIERETGRGRENWEKREPTSETYCSKPIRHLELPRPWQPSFHETWYIVFYCASVWISTSISSWIMCECDIRTCNDDELMIQIQWSITILTKHDA